MSRITASSSLSDVFAAHIPYPSSKDLASWGTITPPLPDGTTALQRQIKIGLFNYDLTSFKTDCAIATQFCHLLDYQFYDGLTLGATIMIKPMILYGPDNGFCFENNKLCTFGYYGNSAQGGKTKYVFSFDASLYGLN